MNAYQQKQQNPFIKYQKQQGLYDHHKHVIEHKSNSLKKYQNKYDLYIGMLAML